MNSDHEEVAILSEFLFEIPPHISTYELYTFCHKSFGKICSVTNTPTDAKFIFIRSPNTEKLKTYTQIQYKSNEITVRWLRDITETFTWLPFKSPKSVDQPLLSSAFQNCSEGIYTEPLWRINTPFIEYLAQCEFDLDKYHSKNIILGMIEEYGHGVNHLKCSIIDKQLQLYRIMARIKTAELLIEIGDIDGLFAPEAVLEELKIEPKKGQLRLPAVKLSRLNTLALYRANDLHEVAQFFALNPQLTTLLLDDRQSISMEMINNDFSCFQFLINLKTITFYCRILPVRDILRVLAEHQIQIETLNIFEPKSSGTFPYEQICQIKSLKRLTLNRVDHQLFELIEECDLMRLISLENLVEINMSGSCRTFQAVQRILQKSIRLKKARLVVFTKEADFVFEAWEHLLDDIGQFLQSRDMQLHLQVVGYTDSQQLTEKDRAVLNRHSNWLQYARYRPPLRF